VYESVIYCPLPQTATKKKRKIGRMPFYIGW
jgi:hypothetical protein